MTASIERARKWVNTWFNAPPGEQERMAQSLVPEFEAARLDEHKLTCHKALLQYDEKGRLIGNLRCGQGWECERRTALEGKGP